MQAVITLSKPQCAEPKYVAKQYAKASERLVKLFDWRAQFGPGGGENLKRVPMDDCSRRVLECLLDKESLDDVLITLADITHAKSENPAADKYEQKQWRRAGDRLVTLRDWCAQFGPGSNCR